MTEWKGALDPGPPPLEGRGGISNNGVQVNLEGGTGAGLHGSGQQRAERRWWQEDETGCGGVEGFLGMGGEPSGKLLVHEHAARRALLWVIAARWWASCSISFPVYASQAPHDVAEPHPAFGVVM